MADMNWNRAMTDLVDAVLRLGSITEDSGSELATAVRRVAHGDLNGPTGLELVAMALAERGEPSVSNALTQIAVAISDLADAVRGLAP
jgi:hypothetical protein